ncbi:MAG: undecaprenyl-diphosphate phosphatase [Desulfuromonas sp.]|nr:undecaprenyl-diphosphate phosphatase [Desulfuromonas sp.]
MLRMLGLVFKKNILYIGFVLLGIFAGMDCQAQQSAAEQYDSGLQKSSAMTLGQAAVLGIVEGVTEYLPVSSTGHLLLAERAMNIGANEDSKEASDAYAICIQIGAILAVFGLYFRRVKQMVNGVLGRDDYGRQLLINVVVGFMPAAVIGLLFNKIIKLYLFGIWPVVAAWFVGGVAILVVSWRGAKKQHPAQGGLSILELSWRMALIIGFAQCIAMWPGVSRSLVTIVGGVLVGLSLSAAVEFSFLLGLVTLSAATAYDALKHGEVMLHTFDGWSLAVGVIFAFGAALISVKWMVAYLNRHGLAIFGYYRVAVALVVALLLVNGVF